MARGDRSFFGFGSVKDSAKQKRNLIITVIILILVVVFVAMTYDKGPLVGTETTKMENSVQEDDE